MPTQKRRGTAIASDGLGVMLIVPKCKNRQGRFSSEKLLGRLQMNVSIDLVLSLIGLVLAISFAVFSSHRAGLPRDDMRPKRLPWRFFVILGGFVGVLFFVHLVNIFGYETGPGQGLFGRF